jgi:hypothetical protein
VNSKNEETFHSPSYFNGDSSVKQGLNYIQNNLLEFTFLIIKEDKEQGIHPQSYHKKRNACNTEFDFWKLNCNITTAF